MAPTTRWGGLLALLIGTLYCFRRFRQADLVRRPGPIEVAEPINATGDPDLRVAELHTAFRTGLGKVDLNSPSPVPGAGQPREFLELLKGAASEKSPLASVAGLIGLTWVTHAYRVTSTLRSRAGAEPCGVTVNVNTLPHGGTTPFTVWAATWPEAIGDAAIGVGAAVLPLTRLCRRPPWRAWRGLTLPPELFAYHLRAKSLTQEHRYDEALGNYFAALELDPLNLHIRLEIGALQEQLHLFLDALETYDDVIAMGVRRDQRMLDALADFRQILGQLILRPLGRRVPLEKRGRRYGEGWRGRRERKGIRPAAWPIRGTDLHLALMLARYRYAMVLGFSEVVVAQWIRDVEGSHPTRRDEERDRLRGRLIPRLSRYPHDGEDDGPSTGIGSPSTVAEILESVTPVGEISRTERQRLEAVDRELRDVIRRAKVRAKAKPACPAEHGVPSREARSDPDSRDSCLRAALALAEDLRPANAEAMRAACRAILRAAVLCEEKDWSDITPQVSSIFDQVRPTRRANPGPVQVFTAQQLLQSAAYAEARALRDDYRWWTGRRRPGLAITRRALRVSLIVTGLRQARVSWMLQRELGGQGMAASQPIAWPPVVSQLDRHVEKAMRLRLWPVHEWQDHYNVACVYAIPLLGDSWAGASTGHELRNPGAEVSKGRTASAMSGTVFAQSVSRALEQAIDSSDSHFAAGRRAWLTSEDPDLVGYRGSPEYGAFQSRNFPGKERPVPSPTNVHVLQLAAYVTELLRSLSICMVDLWTAQLTLATPTRESLHRCLVRDASSWRVVQNVLDNYRDWRSRLDLIDYLEELRMVSSVRPKPVSYPSYPDPRIGDPLSLADPESIQCLTVASRYARQERVDQFDRLAATAKGQLARDTDLARIARLLPLRKTGKDRRRAWRLLDECLAFTFFTDDVDVLRETKVEALEKERQLEPPPTGTPAAPVPRRLDVDAVPSATAASGTPGSASRSIRRRGGDQLNR